MAFDSARRAWEPGLPAICRAPAVGADASAGSGGPRCQGLLPLRARSRASLLLRPSGRIKNSSPRSILLLRPSGRIKISSPHSILLLGPSGRIRIAAWLFDSARRAWEPGLPAICRAPAVETDALAVSGGPRCQGLLPLRARSRASLLLRPSGRIKSSSPHSILLLRPSGRIKSSSPHSILLLRPSGRIKISSRHSILLLGPSGRIKSRRRPHSASTPFGQKQACSMAG
jgi:hypothetical protein